MQMQKKITLKEDGRFLVYYHFPDTATPEETQAFEAVQSIDNAASGDENQPSTRESQGAAPHAGGASHV